MEQRPRPGIASPANPRIHAAVALRERRERESTGLTLVDGAREARRALEAGVEVEAAFVCRPLLTSGEARASVAALGRAHGRRELVEVSLRAFEKLAYGDRSDGIVLVVRPRVRTLAGLELPAEPLVVVTENVEKPGNLGAILRSADGAGVHAVIAADPLTDAFNPNAIRASLGTIFALPVISASSGDTVAWLAGRGIRPVAAIVEASVPYTEADLRGPLAIVLGSEAGGLSAAWRTTGITAVSIPMAGIADSLNVSVAAAVLLFEAVRQRRVT